MALFLMCGKYTAEGVKGISAQRTREAVAVFQQFGGEVKAMYAMLGEKDLLLVVELPGVAAAMQASVALSRMTGIAFTTSPAITVEEFDQLMAGG
jgi:uncharacterized protein with GYD domain